MKQKSLFNNILMILTTILVSLTVTGCNLINSGNTDGVVEKLSIYTVNDFHGAIEPNAYGAAGASRIAEFIMSNKTKAPRETIVISAGDMFQGTGISSYNKGLDVINIMNIIGFDSMTIGNHEFDWGLDTILEYWDEDSTNGEANFPLLGANIYQKSIDGIPEYIDEYTIIDRGGLKVGIVGYIGYGQESDIAVSMVADYRFDSPLECVKRVTKELRTEQEVDIVIVVAHESNINTNNQIAQLSDEYAIDAIVNAHTHQVQSGTIKRLADGREIPYVQAGSSGSNVGVITLNINTESKTVTGADSRNERMTSSIKKNSTVEKYVTNLIKETDSIFGRFLAVAGTEITRYSGAQWGVDALQKYVVDTYGVCDAAFINIGGIRADAFPIAADSNVTVSNIYKIMPFENTIKIVTLTGAQIRAILNSSEIVYSSTITVSGAQIKINNVLIDDSSTYRVAAVDYIFDQPSYPFVNGTDIVETYFLFRDAMIRELERINQAGEKWYA